MHLMRRSTAPIPSPEAGDPPGLAQQAMTLFEAFVRQVEELPGERRHDGFVAQLQAANLLKGDDLTDRFFRVLTELAVRHCLANEMVVPGSLRPGALSFVATDALVRLLVTLIVGESFSLLSSRLSQSRR
jgi:CCR4-NOT transcription complex subunit 1